MASGVLNDVAREMPLVRTWPEGPTTQQQYDESVRAAWSAAPRSCTINVLACVKKISGQEVHMENFELRQMSQCPVGPMG